jgi:ATP-dependent Clp protease, protease subunit
MAKNLTIKFTDEGTSGRIDIIGSISEWNQNNAVDFKARCQELKDSGVTTALVYMMTVGGDCFQANEIVNILIEMFGSYNAEGGALVASAGTYIGVCAATWTVAKNCQVMIHKPSVWAEGNETDIENQLIALRNMTKTYYDAYSAKCKKPKAELDAKWNGGDWWLTAQDAVDWGFVTSIKEPVKIDTTAAMLMRACGAPNTEIINSEINMDIKAMALLVGLPVDATEAQFNARLADLKAKADQYDALKAETERKEKESRTKEVKDLLDSAEKDKRITADVRKDWEDQFAANHEGSKKLLASLRPVSKLSSEITPPADGAGAKYQGKTFEQLQDESPETLAELEDKNPEAYNALFADWKKRNKIK